MNPTEIKKYGESLAKSIIGEIPFVGSFIGEAIFNVRSDVKKDRMINFLSELSEYLKDKGELITNLDDINKETFGDIFEEVLISITKTSASHKKSIFKQILLNQFVKNSNFDNTQRYIAVTNSLTLKQFEILSTFYEISNRVFNYFIEIPDLEMKIPIIMQDLAKERKNASIGLAHSVKTFEDRLKQFEKDIKSKQKAVNQIKEKLQPEFYKISKDEFLIEIQDLVSKGLLVDIGIVNQKYNAFEIVKISELGRDYIKYILHN